MSVTDMNESCHTYEWIMSHMNALCLTWMNHGTRTIVADGSHLSFEELSFEDFHVGIWLFRIFHVGIWLLRTKFDCSEFPT